MTVLEGRGEQFVFVLELPVDGADWQPGALGDQRHGRAVVTVEAAISNVASRMRRRDWSPSGCRRAVFLGIVSPSLPGVVFIRSDISTDHPVSHWSSSQSNDGVPPGSESLVPVTSTQK